MFLKKTFLIGTFALALPLAAQADLITNNTSAEPSTVRLTTGTHMCSGVVGKHGVTEGGEMHHVVPEKIVSDLCRNSPQNVCQADIYMTRNCSGPVIAHASINMNPGPSHGEVKLQDTGHPRYVAVKNGFSEITMSYR